MRTTPVWLLVAVAMGLAVVVSCAPSRAGGAEGGRPPPVRISPLPADQVRLSFEPVARAPALEALSVEQARAVLAAFHAALLAERPRIRILPSPGAGASGEGTQAEWEHHLRQEFLSRFGAAGLPLPDSLEHSRLFQALKRSPRYMGEGVREAAEELFRSPVFLASVALAVLVYFAAWVAPEPLFTKAFAATMTAALALTVGVVELTHLAWACLRLYRESEAASDEEELEAAAQRFGKAVGGTGLRVMVAVASFGVAKAMPTLPPGGMGALLGAPRYAVEGGLALEAASTVQVVEGALVVSGAATGAMASRLCGGLAVCSTAEGSGRSPRLSTRYGPPHTRQNPRHNEVIEEELAAREAAGHTDLRKNKAQRDAEGKEVLSQNSPDGVRSRRPDAASLRPDKVRHNTNYVSNPRSLRRELTAFEAMVDADRRAIHELYLFDGTLIRRYLPRGVNLP